MDGTAIFFWIGMAGLLAVARMLGRWHTEDLARQIAETYGTRPVGEAPVDLPVRHHVTPQEPGPQDAALPDGAERASA